MTYSRSVVGLIFSLALAAAGGHCEPVPRKIILRWQFLAGQKFRIHIETSRESIVTGDSRERREKDQFVADALLTVESVDGHGTAQVSMALERVRLAVQAPEGSFDIDSSATIKGLPIDIALQTQIMQYIVRDMKVQFTIDTRGRVQAARINEDAVKAWQSMLPGGSRRLSESSIAATLKQILPVLPEAPLAVGDMWSDTLVVNRPPGSDFRKMHVKYRYVGPMSYKNGTVERIDTDGTLEWGDEKPPQGVSVRVLAQKNLGVILFDNESGRLVETENTQKRTVEYSKDGRTAREQLSATSKIEVSPARCM